MLPMYPAAPVAATNFPSDIDAENLVNERRRQLALLLQQQANQPIEMPQIPGARLSWANVLAKAFQGYQAGQGLREADRNAFDIQQQRGQAFPVIDALLRKGAGINEVPAQPGVDMLGVAGPAGEESAGASVPASRPAMPASTTLGMPDASYSNQAMEYARRNGVPLDTLKIMQANAEKQAEMQQLRNGMAGIGDKMGYTSGAMLPQTNTAAGVNAPIPSDTAPSHGPMLPGNVTPPPQPGMVPQSPGLPFMTALMAGSTNPVFAAKGKADTKVYENVSGQSIRPGAPYRGYDNKLHGSTDSKGNLVIYDDNDQPVKVVTLPGADSANRSASEAEAGGKAAFEPHSYVDRNNNTIITTKKNIAEETDSRLRNGTATWNGTGPAPSQLALDSIRTQPSGIVGQNVARGEAAKTEAEAGAKVIQKRLDAAAELHGPAPIIIKAAQDVQEQIEKAMPNGQLTTGSASAARGALTNWLVTLGIGTPEARERIINNQTLDPAMITATILALKDTSGPMRVFQTEMKTALDMVGRDADPKAIYRVMQSFIDRARTGAEKQLNDVARNAMRTRPDMGDLTGIMVDLPPDRPNPWAPKGAAPVNDRFKGATVERVR